ncbi:unnamed protein product [Pylaiella littoralis]
MSTHAQGKARRNDASGAINRFDNSLRDLGPDHYNPHDVDNFPDTPEYDRLQCEAYVHVQYWVNPDKTLREYFQNIADKCRVHTSVSAVFDALPHPVTVPDLLRLTFTRGNLSAFGF